MNEQTIVKYQNQEHKVLEHSYLGDFRQYKLASAFEDGSPFGASKLDCEIVGIEILDDVDFGTRVKVAAEVGDAVAKHSGKTGVVIGLRMHSVARYVVALDDLPTVVFFCGNEISKT
jgi:hypothetical protein